MKKIHFHKNAKNYHIGVVILATSMAFALMQDALVLSLGALIFAYLYLVNNLVSDKNIHKFCNISHYTGIVIIMIATMSYIPTFSSLTPLFYPLIITGSLLQVLAIFLRIAMIWEKYVKLIKKITDEP